jgi:putative transposase
MPRTRLNGVPLHLVLRGHNRGACFFDERDDLANLGWPGEALPRKQRFLHAMTAQRREPVAVT